MFNPYFQQGYLDGYGNQPVQNPYMEKIAEEEAIQELYLEKLAGLQAIEEYAQQAYLEKLAMDPNLRNALIGSAIGGGVGALGGYYLSPEEEALQNALLAGGAGALAGGAGGYYLTPEPVQKKHTPLRMNPAQRSEFFRTFDKLRRLSLSKNPRVAAEAKHQLRQVRNLLHGLPMGK